MLPLTQRLTKQKFDIQDITDFVLKYGLYQGVSRNQIEDYVEKHMNYGTILTARDKGKIIGVCRWNSDDPQVLNVLDLIIHPDYRNKRVLKSMLIQGLLNYPWYKYIKFHRKKHNRDTNVLIKDFIGGSYGRF
jgi:N-acetylglutamate synthase-like GNAT family acetyltransferase